MFEHILLPLDGSQLAETAIPYVVTLCKKLDSQVTLLHVIEKDAPVAIHGQSHLTNEKDAYEYLQKVARGEFGFSCRVICHVHSEQVSRVSSSIVDHSSEFQPDLIVLCAHGEGGMRDFMIGSIAQQVIADGKIPVLLIHPEHRPLDLSEGFSSLMVALDGEPDHDRSMDIAGELAMRFNSTIRFIRVVPTFFTLSGEQAALGSMLPGTTNAYLDIMEEEACEYLQEKLEVWRKKGINCAAEVQRGDPAQEVVKSALNSNANIIVLGTHGRSGLNAFWSGSVAPKIVAKTLIPVLLYPVRR
ncbi:MAG: universal stress protein [Chloroflexi bacterium]|nr:universal stress protein [Chloroflexota bacterium]